MTQRVLCDVMMSLHLPWDGAVGVVQLHRSIPISWGLLRCDWLASTAPKFCRLTTMKIQLAGKRMLPGSHVHP